MTTSALERLFVGIVLSDDVRHGLAAHLESGVPPPGLPGRVTPPENWHVTLRFFGMVSEPVRERLTAQLGSGDLGAPFSLAFGQLGAFPGTTRATVLWLGIERGSERLVELATYGENTAQTAGLSPEDRPFHAHVTLSRIRPQQNVSHVISRVAPFPLKMRVEAVSLFRSHLGGRGPARYEVVETFGLV